MRRAEVREYLGQPGGGTEDGFRSDPGVSYLVKTDLGALLFDVGFGPDSPTLSHNAN